MTGLFVTVLNMSLIASLTALVVLLIRWCLKGRAPRWISYALWAVVLIRLLVPVSVSSPVSLFSLVPSQSTDAVGQSGRLSRLDVTGGAPARIPVSDRAGQDGSVAFWGKLHVPSYIFAGWRVGKILLFHYIYSI